MELGRRFSEQTNAGTPVNNTSTPNTVTKTCQRNECDHGAAFSHSHLCGQCPGQKGRDAASAAMVTMLTKVGESWKGINMVREVRAHKACGERKWAVETKGEEEQCRMRM